MISVEDFKKFCYGKNPTEYRCVTGPDYYYSQNDHVVRHRVKDGKDSELTVKRRKSGVSSQDRLEIDLYFAPGTPPERIDSFLAAIGFKLCFKLVKTAHIFYLNKGSHSFSVVHYTVGKEENGKLVDNKTFLEIEIDKQAKVTVERAKTLLREWKQELQQEFKELKEPLNESLWEIFSGRQYKQVEKEEK